MYVGREGGREREQDGKGKGGEVAQFTIVGCDPSPSISSVAEVRDCSRSSSSLSDIPDLAHC